MLAVNHLTDTLLLAQNADIGGMMFPLLLGFGLVYFMIIRPQKREQDEREQMHSALKKNDEVLTTGGIIGTIASLKDDEVTLKVDDKVKIRFKKNAIIKVLGAEAETPPQPETTKQS